MEVEKSNRFSYSRLSAYKGCPRRYRYRYVDKLKRERRTASTFLGTCVHAALEEFYRRLHRGLTMPLDELLEAYAGEWKAGWSDSIKIHDERKPEDFRKTGERCLRDYYANHAPFDDGMAHEVEKRLSVTLPVDVDGEGIECVIEGILDRFSIPRREHDRVEIHDYKTNEHCPTQEDFDKKFSWQFNVYDLLVRRHYPEVRRVQVVYHFLQSGRELRPGKDPAEDRTASAVEWIAGLIRDIKRDHSWEPHRSILCDWCEYRDICPLWAHGEKVGALPAREMSRDEGVRLVNKLADLEADRKRLKEELEGVSVEEDDVKERLIEFAGSLPEAGGERKVVVSGTKGEVVVTEKEELKFPTRTHSPDQLAEFEGLLKDMSLWRDVSRVDPHLLVDGLRRKSWGPEVLAAVEALVQRFAHVVKEKQLRFRRKKGEEEPG